MLSLKNCVSVTASTVQRSPQHTCGCAEHCAVLPQPAHLSGYKPFLQNKRGALSKPAHLPPSRKPSVAAASKSAKSVCFCSCCHAPRAAVAALGSWLSITQIPMASRVNTDSPERQKATQLTSVPQSGLLPLSKWEFVSVKLATGTVA